VRFEGIQYLNMLIHTASRSYLSLSGFVRHLQGSRDSDSRQYRKAGGASYFTERPRGVNRARAHGTRSGRSFGRPHAVLRRDEAIELRAQGQSWRQIAKRLRERSKYSESVWALAYS
jgi:hypothetical protein